MLDLIKSLIEILRDNFRVQMYDYAYIYARDFIPNTKMYDINNPYRIDKYGNKVELYFEIVPSFKPIAGVALLDTKAVVSFPDELSSQEQNTLTEIVYNHKNNVADAYAIKKNTGIFVPDPNEPLAYLLFNTQEEAQQYIIDNDLAGASLVNIAIID